MKSMKTSSRASIRTPPESRNPSPSAQVKKPMRPLTAYHIFFQIEREYIIQTTAGPIADKSIHNNKSYRGDVPRRYRCIMLLPDWYAGPGKRKKRKHRKSHGKIGFFELSQIISKRWATLGTTDPETKRFVTMIAARELAEYKLEMKHYKERTEKIPSAPTPSASPTPFDVNAAATETVDAMLISPSESSSLRPVDVSSSSLPSTVPRLQQPILCMPVGGGKLVLSPDKAVSPASTPNRDDEIDYSICCLSKNGHYIPSPPALSSSKGNMFHPDGTIYDPLFELENGHSFQQTTERRCVSPLSSEVEIDVMSDKCFVDLLS